MFVCTHLLFVTGGRWMHSPSRGVFVKCTKNLMFDDKLKLLCKKISQCAKKLPEFKQYPQQVLHVILEPKGLAFALDTETKEKSPDHATLVTYGPLLFYVRHVVDSNYSQKVVLACLKCKSVHATKRCGHCKTAKYCSAACQRNDWQRHKPLCFKKNE